MGWEQRERGVGSYYYQSRRVGDRVQKVYRGGGRIGQLAALLDEDERLRREEETARWEAERRRLKAITAYVRELEAAKILATAHLIAAGYHKHKGEWRRLRESA